VDSNENSGCLGREIVAAFVAGALDDADVPRVEAHLAGCAACAGVVADAAYGAGDIGTRAPGSEQFAETLLESGTLWAGKYRIEGLLGRGGMGSVYSAFHEDLRHRVAIKILHSGDAASAGRLIREAQITARLGGVHVPRIFDLGRVPGGAPYIVMEYLIGEDLAQVLARGPVSPSEAVDYVLQACVVLGPAHAAGVVHRDLKPANLYLAAQEGGPSVLKVLDFGISKGGFQEDAVEAQSLTSTGTLVGSPLYMSPEQIRASKDVDARSDVWSLGVILHELVTGERPFHGDTLSALAVAIATEAPSRPSALCPGVAPGLELAILRCLEKERAARFPSVASLSQAIAPFAKSTTGGAQSRSKPGRVSLARLGALAVGAVAVLSLAAFEIGGRTPSDGARVAAPSNSFPVFTTNASAASTFDASPAPSAPPPAPARAIQEPGPAAPLAVTAGVAAVHAVSTAAPSTQRLDPAASAPCKLVKTVDKTGEVHFSCPCTTCR
jgi:serine/threonine-protein kinase